MQVSPSLETRLAAGLRGGLLPQRFPPRRDLELAGDVAGSDAATAFHDHLRPCGDRLALIAARVGAGGLDGALKAACLRHLLRAALATAERPDAVLAASLDAFEGRFATTSSLDIALCLVNPVTGDLANAAVGHAFAGQAGGGAAVERAGPGRSRLVPGSVAWVVAGPAARPDGMTLASDGPTALVRAAVRNQDGCAAAALLIKATVQPTARTFVLPNDLGRITWLNAQIEAACREWDVPEDAMRGLEIALDEVLTNIVAYAYDDGCAHEIHVTVSAQAGRLAIEVMDDGLPFDPLTVPTPDLAADLDGRQVGGLGMHFVRSVLDAVSYSRVKGWNVLTLEKCFSHSVAV